MTEVAANPVGTGPPARRGSRCAGRPVVADPLAADAEGELEAPPADDAGDADDAADDAIGELDAPPPPAPELADPHADSADRGQQGNGRKSDP